MKINGFHILDAPVVAKKDGSPLFRILDGKLILEGLIKWDSNYSVYKQESGLKVFDGSEFKGMYDKNGNGRLDIFEQKLLIINVPECLPH